MGRMSYHADRWYDQPAGRVLIGVLGLVLLAVTLMGAGWSPFGGVPDQVRQDAKDQAEIYCTLGGVVPGMTSLYDPRYRACVRSETQSSIEQWEAAH